MLLLLLMKMMMMTKGNSCPASFPRFILLRCCLIAQDGSNMFTTGKYNKATSAAAAADRNLFKKPFTAPTCIYYWLL